MNVLLIIVSLWIDCVFDESIISNFVDSLKQLNNLEELTLENCNINYEIMFFLKDGLMKLQKLTFLDLSCI